MRQNHQQRGPLLSGAFVKESVPGIFQAFTFASRSFEFASRVNFPY
jgi:hypothetical protein